MSEARAKFRALHQEGCFVIPNPWDAGSAIRLKNLGFQALASSSAAAAWTLGRADGELGLDDALAHLAMLCAATDLPVNADFEEGFAGDAAGVAASVTRAIATGVAGLSIEDRPAGRGRDLYSLEAAVERIRAARSAIDASGEDVILVARNEGFLVGRAPTLARRSPGCGPMRRRARTASTRPAWASSQRSPNSSPPSPPSRSMYC